MREIKFRIWDNIHKVMVYIDDAFKMYFDDEHFESYELIFDENKNLICRGFNTIDAEYGDELIDITYFDVQLYTGLKDKNGVEIYENDIILIGEKRRQVEVIFLNGQFGYLYEASCVSFQYQKPEVVGNIYDKEVK